VGKVEVKLDGSYSTEKCAGKDVRIKNGVSFADVKWLFMHNLERGSVHLTIKSIAKDILLL
jgi:hypothetical protein